MTEAAQQRVKSGEVPRSQIDSWERRQLKQARKLRKALATQLQAHQMLFEIRANIEASEEGAKEEPSAAMDAHTAATARYASFAAFFKAVVVEPFAAFLYEPILELCTEMELPDELVEVLKQRHAEALRGQTRKVSRKPTTPAKITKEAPPVKCETKTVESKEV